MDAKNLKLLEELLAMPGDSAQRVALDMILENTSQSDHAALVAGLNSGNVTLTRLVRHLSGRPTWERRCSPTTASTVRMRVERVNKTIARKRGAAWEVIVGPEIRTVLSDGYERIEHDVTVYGPPYPQVVPGYRLIGVISSAYEKGDVRDADGQLLRVVPGGENREADMTALIGKSHRCSHCGSSRKRNHLLVAEGPNREILTFGGDCAESYIPDRQAVEALLQFLDAARGHGGLEGAQEDGCKFGWSPCNAVRYVIAVCDHQGRFTSTREAKLHGHWSTSRHVIAELWPWWVNDYDYTLARGEDRGDIETSKEATAEISHPDVTLKLSAMQVSARDWAEGIRSVLWTNISEWCETKQDGSAFWANCASALHAQCVTWRTYGLITAVAGMYWRDNLAPKAPTMPEAWKAAFVANGGEKMTIGVLAVLTAVPCVDLKLLDELVAHGLILHYGAFVSLPMKAAPPPSKQTSEALKSPTMFESARQGDIFRDIGHGTIVYAETRKSEFNNSMYWSYIVRLDIGSKIMFSRSQPFDGNDSVKGARVRIDRGTFKGTKGYNGHREFLLTRTEGVVL